MATSNFRKWARGYAARPDIAAKLAHVTAKAIVAEAELKTAAMQPFVESYARGMAEAETRVAEAKARMEERRQVVATPSAAGAVTSLMRTPVCIDEITAEHADLKACCAACGNDDDIVVGMRDEVDELGCVSQSEGAYCWRCGRFDDIAYAATNVLHQAVAA